MQVLPSQILVELSQQYLKLKPSPPELIAGIATAILPGYHPYQVLEHCFTARLDPPQSKSVLPSQEWCTIAM
jgi:hypothetical protein